jgi:excinuclease UvrABC nuclease subunit
MPPQSYSLNFKGYWREKNISSIPAESGAYCVYASTYNPQNDTVSIRLLVYIGEAEDVKNRVANHEKWSDWRRYCQQGEELCFNSAAAEASDRERVECALIFHHRPPVNTDCKDSFSFDATTISTSGRNALLDDQFTVWRT